jgi:hypothetical protein
MSQAGLTSLLIKSGATQLAAAFVWGTQLPNTKYPRIALSTHMNMIQEGLLAVAAGLIVRDPTLIGLSDWQVNLIVAAHVGMWIFDISGMLNSFWGTNKTLKMVFFALSERRLNVFSSSPRSLMLLEQRTGKRLWLDLLQLRSRFR